MSDRSGKNPATPAETLEHKLLQSVREMKAGQRARATPVELNEVAEARYRTGLSQAQFAQLLGISKRTLQDWEQGRRSPSGAARALIRIAKRNPEAILDEVP
jgi:putative transcriptional regulator